ncbi:MAG: DUF4845 domain-containing protein [Gammaproteobacteria bacterium]|nr:DUF4845 domain-containing protein [Gammaproteobacteria bacterium]
MRSRQQGITFIGLLIIAAMVGTIGYAGLQLTPIYLENTKIKRILKDVKLDLDGQNPSPQSIRRAIDKRINIEMVYDIKGRDFDVEQSSGGYIVAARYEKAAPFVANVSLLATFDDEVEIRK